MIGQRSYVGVPWSDRKMAIRLIFRKTIIRTVAHGRSAGKTSLNRLRCTQRTLSSVPPPRSEMIHHADLILSSTSVEEIHRILYDLELEKHGSKKHYIRAIDRIGQLGQVEEAMKIPLIMHSTGKFNREAIASTCMEALILCRVLKRIDLAESLLMEMEKIGGNLAPDKFHYREVILCCSKSDPIKIMEILERMNSFGCVPDIHCYHAALSKTSKSNNINLSLTILSIMRNIPDCIPDLYAFNLVLSSLSGGGDGFKKIARQLILGTMPAVGVMPDEYSYCLAMTAAVKEGDWEEALELYAHYCDQAKKREADRDDSDTPQPIPFRLFKSVLLACSTGGESEGALEIISHIMKIEDRFDNPTHYDDALACYNMAITACANAEEVTSALSIYEYVDDHKILQPDRYTCSAAMYACGIIGDWETAAALMYAAENIHKLSPHCMLYTTMMGAYARSGKWEEAEQILESMLKMVDERSGDDLVDIYPNDFTFEALFRAGAKAKNPHIVRKWFRKWKLIHERAPGPADQLRELGTFRIALISCLETRDWDMGLEILKDYREMLGWSEEATDALAHLNTLASTTHLSKKKVEERSAVAVKTMNLREKWLAQCDALLMSSLSYASLETAHQMIKEFSLHRTYQPHRLVKVYIQNRFNRTWEELARDGLLNKT